MDLNKDGLVSVEEMQAFVAAAAAADDDDATAVPAAAAADTPVVSGVEILGAWEESGGRVAASSWGRLAVLPAAVLGDEVMACRNYSCDGAEATHQIGVAATNGAAPVTDTKEANEEGEEGDVRIHSKI